MPPVGTGSPSTNISSGNTVALARTLLILLYHKDPIQFHPRISFFIKILLRRRDVAPEGQRHQGPQRLRIPTLKLSQLQRLLLSLTPAKF